jgi:hypothetical protein
MKQAPVNIKKISPYPISAALNGRYGTTPGRIVKITNVGFLIETLASVSVGDQFTVSFVIPVHEKKIETAVVVIKTYLRHGGELGKSSTEHLNELHFKTLGEDHKLSIQQFLTAIKQS